MPTALSSCLTKAVAEARRLAHFSPSLPGELILTHLIDTLPFAALVADNTGRYIAGNRQASDLTGYSAAELKTICFWQLTPGIAQQDADMLWRAFLDQYDQTGEYALKTLDGTLVKAVYAARANVLPGWHLSLFMLPGH